MQKICQQSSSGGDSLEEQLVNSEAPEIAIYLRMHIFTRVLSTQLRKALTYTSAFRADLYERTRIGSTRFVWTVVILCSIEAVNHF